MIRKTFLPILLVFLLSTQLTAQESTSNSSITVGSDIVSSYVWRGLLFDPAVNIQPTLDFTFGNFSVGSWGSYNINGTYAEPDFYLAYTYNNISLTVFDFHNGGGQDFFNYDSDETLHLIETMLTVSGGDNFPLYLTASLMVYGDDKKIDGTDPDTGTPLFSTDNNYSSYFEVGYSLAHRDASVDIFAGVSPGESYFYGTDDFGLINLGLTGSRTINVTDSFSIPTFVSIVGNPDAEQMYFVFGISL